MHSPSPSKDMVLTHLRKLIYFKDSGYKLQNAEFDTNYLSSLTSVISYLDNLVEHQQPLPQNTHAMDNPTLPV